MHRSPGRQFRHRAVVSGIFDQHDSQKAGIPERWGYRRSGGARCPRAIVTPSGLHQVDTGSSCTLGFPNGPIRPLSPFRRPRESGRAWHRCRLERPHPTCRLAPGAAYGGAKRWPPEYFAELAGTLASDGVDCAIVGTPADAATAAEVARAFAARVGGAQSGALHNVVGQTDLPALAGLLANCRALVTNDSGAMHLAAAIGVPVTAVFGPTDDRATHPLGEAHVVVTHPVWCRPCMLRECPLDHRAARLE
jgi:heptosyltransferase-2